MGGGGTMVRQELRDKKMRGVIFISRGMCP